jgi:putative glutamine amidotransferase
VRIAVTRLSTGKYPLYGAWLRRVDAALELVDLEQSPDPAAALAESDGLLLPGGADVAPHHYGQTDPDNLCNGIDPGRDALELLSLERALGAGTPVLGICRGLQLANVGLGGTLLLDLPRAGVAGHGKIDGRDASHGVAVEETSLLRSITRRDRGTVNSAHHQAADIVAQSLRVSARSGDGVIEALEWNEADRKPFLLLVQWHPERMQDAASPFSRPIAESFLRACAGNG